MISIFGTTGIRRIFAGYGDEYEKFTPAAALKIGLAIGTYIDGGTVIVGRDIRTTALPIELALNSGLISTGCRVLTIGMVTTPTVAMSMKFLDGDCGVMITASHNTPEYIGMKLWNRSGLGFTPEQEMELEQIYRSGAFKSVSWNKIGKISEVNNINDLHVEEILKLIELGPKKPPNVIIDPGNGSSFEIAPSLIKKLGCKFVTLNSNPDGHFPGRLSEPNSKNLRTLISFIKSTDDMDFGIALDGDADRVIFVDGNGKIIEPIRLLSFLAKKKIEKDPPRNGRFHDVVTPINSSSVIERVLEPIRGRVIRTKIGDIKVAIRIRKQRAILGGENVGTYIWPKFHYGPDSLVTIAKIVEILTHEDRSFTELLEDIPETPFIHKTYDLIEDKQFNEEDYDIISSLLGDNLTESGYEIEKITRVDGVRLDFHDGWLLVRKSGTSPKLRVSGEHEDFDKLESLIESVARELNQKFPIDL